MNRINRIKREVVDRKRRYNQTEIAKRVGIGQSYISQILSGSRRPSPELLKKIEKAIKGLNQEGS